MRFIFITVLLLFSRAHALQAEELTLDDLRTPSAKDILNQIEGGSMAAPPAEMLKDGLSLNYNAEDTEPNEEQRLAIEAHVVKSFDKGRIKILSYATEGESEVSSARRISLERAIKVREFLKTKGISHRHVDMFPMGDQMPPPARDQVLIHIIRG